ncbi:MAG: hypothetical protein K9K32_07490 [Halanaerobiales bacterium]|nr:hypothetical protein [Halanaerobiales bacterium]
MDKKHTRKHCKNCLWPNIDIGCQVFDNRSDPILNDDGFCNARITNKSKFEKLQRELQ